jgi:hypothetical protein
MPSPPPISSLHPLGGPSAQAASSRPGVSSKCLSPARAISQMHLPARVDAGGGGHAAADPRLFVRTARSSPGRDCQLWSSRTPRSAGPRAGIRYQHSEDSQHRPECISSLDTFTAESGDVFLGDAGDIARYSFAPSSFATETVRAYAKTSTKLPSPGACRSIGENKGWEPLASEHGILEGLWSMGTELISASSPSGHAWSKPRVQDAPDPLLTQSGVRILF